MYKQLFLKVDEPQLVTSLSWLSLSAQETRTLPESGLYSLVSVLDGGGKALVCIYNAQLVVQCCGGFLEVWWKRDSKILKISHLVQVTVAGYKWLTV
jgi:hypothetical protein